MTSMRSSLWIVFGACIVVSANESTATREPTWLESDNAMKYYPLNTSVLPVPRAVSGIDLFRARVSPFSRSDRANLVSRMILTALKRGGFSNPHTLSTRVKRSLHLLDKSAHTISHRIEKFSTSVASIAPPRRSMTLAGSQQRSKRNSPVLEHILRLFVRRRLPSVENDPTPPGPIEVSAPPQPLFSRTNYGSQQPKVTNVDSVPSVAVAKKQTEEISTNLNKNDHYNYSEQQSWHTEVHSGCKGRYTMSLVTLVVIALVALSINMVC